MLESGIVGCALPRKRTKENGIGGFNSRAKMGFVVYPMAQSWGDQRFPNCDE